MLACRAALPILLLAGLLPGGASELAPDDREALTSALRVLRSGYDEQAAARAIGILENPDSGVRDYGAYFGEFLSQQSLTSELSRFLGDRALGAAAPAQRRMLQEALARIAVQQIEDVLRSELPDGMPTLAADRARFDQLRASLVLLGRLAWVPVGSLLLLALAQIPMTIKLVRRLRQPRYLGFVPMSMIRAFWRGFGMVHGLLAYLWAGSGASHGPPGEEPTS